MDPSRRRPPPPRISIDPHSPKLATNGQFKYPATPDAADGASDADVNLMERRCKQHSSRHLLRLGAELRASWRVYWRAWLGRQSQATEAGSLR